MSLGGDLFASSKSNNPPFRLVLANNPPFRLVFILLTISLASNALTSLVNPVLPAALDRLRIPHFYLGFISASSPLASLLSGFGVQHLSQIFGRETVLKTGLLLLAFGSVVLGLVGQEWPAPADYSKPFGSPLTEDETSRAERRNSNFVISSTKNRIADDNYIPLLFLIGARSIQGVGSALATVAALSAASGGEWGQRHAGMLMGLNEMAIGIGFVGGAPLGSFLDLTYGFAAPFFLGAFVLLSLLLPFGGNNFGFENTTTLSSSNLEDVECNRLMQSEKNSTPKRVLGGERV